MTEGAAPGAASGGAPDVPAHEVPLEIVVAMTREGLIGRDNTLPWHHSEDLKHFKALTTGHALLMGRHTWESLGRPLPKRRHLIVSRTVGQDPEGVERDGVRWFASVDGALNWYAAEQSVGGIPVEERLFVIGGGQLYGDLLASETHRPATLHVTWVPSMLLQAGDVRFAVDEAWIEAHYQATERRQGDDGALEYVTYRKLES